jgi:hypothetical protein
MNALIEHIKTNRVLGFIGSYLDAHYFLTTRPSFFDSFPETKKGTTPLDKLK